MDISHHRMDISHHRLGISHCMGIALLLLALACSQSAAQPDV